MAISAMMLGLASAQAACALSERWATSPQPANGGISVAVAGGKPMLDGRPVDEATLRDTLRGLGPPPRRPLTLYRHGASCADVRRIAALVELARDCKPTSCFVSDADAPPPSLRRVLSPLGNPGAWVTNDDYPAGALRARQQGTSAFTLDVDEKGLVTGCVVTSSSQSPWLDDATCRLLTARARFNPALDEQGKPVASQYRNRFRWMIPAPPESPIASWTSELRFTIGPDGEVVSCRVTPYGPVPTERGLACRWLDSRPPAALKQLRGSASGQVTIVMRAEQAVEGLRLPPAPPMPTEFKTVTTLRTRLEVGPDGVPTACYRDRGQGEMAAPAETCRDLARFRPSAAAHTIRGLSLVYTDGDLDIVDALAALYE